MGNSSYADVADVAAMWGQPIPEEQTPHVQALLDGAMVRLRRKVPGLDTKVQAGSITRDEVEQVQVEIVLRVLRNPGAYTSVTTGPFGYQMNSQAGLGMLTVTDDDLELLGESHDQAYSIDLGGLPRFTAEPRR